MSVKSITEIVDSGDCCLVCDECGAESEVFPDYLKDPGSYWASEAKEMEQKLAKQGWTAKYKTIKNGHKWIHLCPKHSEVAE